MSLQLNTTNGIFGPHDTITDEGDFYLCDTTVVPKTVTGVGTIEAYVEPQEVADERARLIGTALAEDAFERNFNAEQSTLPGLDNIKVLLAVLTCLIEIRAYQANNAVPTPAIDECAARWGITRGQAVTRILNKYGPKLANLVGVFADREDALDALP